MPGLGEFFRGLFSGKGAEPAPAVEEEAVDYKGYSIRAAPRQQASQWTTEGVIAKQFPEGMKETRFIRADTHSDKKDAVASCIAKAKRIIDEQGDQMFAGR